MSLGASKPEPPIDSEYKFSVPEELNEFLSLKEAPTLKFNFFGVVILY